MRTQPLPECKPLDKAEKTIRALRNAKWTGLNTEKLGGEKA